MPRAEPGKKAEARRLVEVDGLSLAEAADRVGVNRGTVRAWQKADEQAGDGWSLRGESSTRQKAVADGLTEDERKALVERAKRAATAKWVNRRETEADAAGLTATQVRNGIHDAAVRYRAAIATGDVEQAASLALSAQRWAVPYGILFDKADRGSGVERSPSTSVTVVESSSTDEYDGRMATVLDLLGRTVDGRRAS